jgi:3'-5' exoribonuclease
MQKKFFITDIKEGQSIIDCFLVSSKKSLITKKGKPYISLVLQDKTGLIDGKIWEEDGKSDFAKNDFVKIEAIVQSYQEEPQLNIKKIKKIELHELDVSDFVSSTQKDTSQMFQELQMIAKEVKNPYFSQLLNGFLADEEFKKKFCQSPAAKRIHHICIGGLLEHTLSVARICYFLAKERYTEINFDLLITGAILHDIGKIYELSLLPAIDYTDAGKLLGHILLGFRLVQEKINTISGFPADLQILIEHLIVSHHGEYEWGSPKLPQTPEAIILHYVDDLDAKINSVQQLIKSKPDEEGNWTAYHKALGRSIYIEKNKR